MDCMWLVQKMTTELVAVVNSSNLVSTRELQQVEDTIARRYNCLMSSNAYVKAFEERWNSDRIYFQLKFRKRASFLWGRARQNKNRILSCLLNCYTAEKKACHPEILIVLGISELLLVHLLSCVLAALMAQKTFLSNEKLGKLWRLRLDHLWFWIISVLICWKPIGWVLVWSYLEIASCHWARKSLCKHR